MLLEQILGAAVRGGASDIILKTGAIPRFRFNGELITLANGQPLRPEVMQSWIQQMLPATRRNFESKQDYDFAYQTRDGYRFRVNVFQQRGQVGIVLRVILGHVRTLEELQLPKILGQLTREKRGLIVVTGATGSGKSTTLAAMMERINRERSSHIITIEDPIEFLIEDQKSTVEQREVGIDTDSFAIALRAALRQNPDVIMVGELRDAETVQTALRAAETGHLVLTTLHTADAPESMQRLLSFFEPHAQQNIRMTLAQVLRAIISQRLIMRVDSGGMVAAVEVLIGTSLVRDIIARGESTDKLVDAIKQNGANWGMQSFDDSLIALAQARMISTEDALNNATSRGDMELRLQGVGS